MMRTGTDDTALQGHAAVMDRVYRRQRHFYDLTRKYYLFGRDTMLDAMVIPEGARVLEVGCGTGRNMIAAARRTPHALFYGFDISTQMLESAAGNVERSSAKGRIFLAQGDAESFDACAHFGVGGFDRVFLSYTVSMIPGWQQAIRHALTQLKPGGSLHLVDFGAMDAWPGFARSAMQHWLSRFHVTPRAGLDQHLAELAKDTGLNLHTVRLGGGYAVIATLTPARRPISQPARRSAVDWFAQATHP